MENTPSDYARPKKKGYEIRIKRVSVTMHDHIKNVAAHLGVSVTDYCKVELLKSLAAAPKHYLQPFKED